MPGRLMRLLSPGGCSNRAEAKRSVPLFRGSWEHSPQPRIHARGLVKGGLLLVEYVPANVVRSLTVVELGPVRVATVLRES